MTVPMAKKEFRQKATPHKDNIEKYRSEQRKHPRGTPNSVRPVGVIGPEII